MPKEWREQKFILSGLYPVRHNLSIIKNKMKNNKLTLKALKAELDLIKGKKTNSR